MRRTLIVCLLTLGLLATPLALADGDAAPGNGHGKAVAKAARDNRTDNHTGNHSDKGNHTHGNDTADKPAWVAAFQARLKALRDSWRENASEVRETCHAAAKPANNSSKDARLAWAHCIRDGYKAFLEEWRAERKEARMARDA